MATDTLTQDIIEFADERGADADPFPIGIEGVTLVRQRQPTLVYPVVYQPIFCLVLQGAKETYLGTDTVRFSSGQSLIVGLDLPAKARVVEASAEHPYVALALFLDMDLIRELAIDLKPVSESGAARGVDSGVADAAVVDAMRRLFDLHAMSDAQQVLVPLIKREIHYWLLTANHGRILLELAERDSHAHRIARAVAAIRQDITVTVRVEELARLSGMSVSAFHAGFKQLTGTSPLQFQKQLRLMEARRLLQGNRMSVSGAAFEVGYESPTQFSREYSRTFGVSPRVDKRAEEIAPAP